MTPTHSHDHHAKTNGKSNGSSSSSSCLRLEGPTKQRHPVIIYTHSPKVIHTHPKDFRALVQKLTGLSPQENAKGSPEKNCGNDDNESSSVITDENCGNLGDGQVTSCFVAPTVNFEPPNPYITNFTPNPAHLLCANHSFYNYTDSSFINPPNNGSLEGFNEFHEC